MTDDQFEGLFKKFGEMKSCKIVRNRNSGYSYGFGFVDFKTNEQALKAIEELNGHEVDNKKIKVAFARPAGQDIKQANLYIKNVPNEWTQDDIKKVFEPYGNIIQVRVLGNNRGVAFVLYDLRKQAEDALEALNNKKVEGCEQPLEIKFAADKKIEKNTKSNKSNNQTNNNNNNISNNNNNNNNQTNKAKDKGQRGTSKGRQNNQRNNNFNNNNNNNSNNNFNNNNRQGGRQNRRNFNDNRQNDNDNNNYRQNNNNNNKQRNHYQNNNNNYNQQPYGSNYSNNNLGPIRSNNNRMNRYAPFGAQAIAPAPMAAAPMAPQMAAGPYGFPAQQQMMPFAMMPAQALGMGAVGQPGQLAAQNPMSMYGVAAAATQMPVGFAPMAQNTMTSMYAQMAQPSNNQIAATTLQAGNQMGGHQQVQMGGGVSNRQSHNQSGGGGNKSSSYNDDPASTLFVYNITPDDDESELRKLFAPHGQVMKCNIVRKTPGGESKGFAFVTMKDPSQAKNAISKLDGSFRNGRNLQVSMKK